MSCHIIEFIRGFFLLISLSEAKYIKAKPQESVKCNDNAHKTTNIFNQRRNSPNSPTPSINALVLKLQDSVNSNYRVPSDPSSPPPSGNSSEATQEIQRRLHCPILVDVDASFKGCLCRRSLQNQGRCTLKDAALPPETPGQQGRCFVCNLHLFVCLFLPNTSRNDRLYTPSVQGSSGRMEG